MVSLLRGCYLESLVGAFLRSSFGAKQTLHFNPPCLRPSESAVCVSGSCDELTCVIDLCFCSFQVRQRVSEQTVPDMVTTNRCFSIPYKFNQKENISEKYPGICEGQDLLVADLERSEKKFQVAGLTYLK